MDFEWDETKRQSNLVKHGYDFVDVVDLFGGPHLAGPAQTKAGEERWLAIGLIDGLPATVIFTRRQNAIRIISLRRSRHEERRKYHEVFGG